MDKFIEQADNHEIIQKENTEWYMSDLQIRYGVSNSRILSDFMSNGLPYYKVGREYRFRPEEVIEWEKRTHKIPYGRDDYIKLPGYLFYVHDSEEKIKQAEQEGNKEEAEKIKDEMRSYGIKIEKREFYISILLWMVIFIIIVIIISLRL